MVCETIKKMHRVKKKLLQKVPSKLKKANSKGEVEEGVTTVLTGLSVVFWPDILKAFANSIGMFLDPISK